MANSPKSNGSSLKTQKSDCFTLEAPFYLGFTSDTKVFPSETAPFQNPHFPGANYYLLTKPGKGKIKPVDPRDLSS
jgi:hypothetical protein